MFGDYFIFHEYQSNILLREHPKRKQTKRVLRNIYYSPQSKDSISLEVGDETKNFTDSAFGNSLDFLVPNTNLHLNLKLHNKVKANVQTLN